MSRHKLTLVLVALGAVAACSQHDGGPAPVATSDDLLVTAQTDNAIDAPVVVLGDDVYWVRAAGAGLDIVKAKVDGTPQVVFSTPPSMIDPRVSKGPTRTRAGAGAASGRVYFTLGWSKQVSDHVESASGTVEIDGATGSSRVIDNETVDLACGDHVYFDGGESRIGGGSAALVKMPSNIGVASGSWCVADQVMVLHVTKHEADAVVERFYRWEDDGRLTLLSLPRLPDTPDRMLSPFALLHGNVVPLYALWPGPSGNRYRVALDIPDVAPIRLFRWEQEIAPIGVVRDADGHERIAFVVNADQTVFGTTDGTIAGTRFDTTIAPQFNGGRPIHAEIVDGKAYGTLNVAVRKRRFFETDGSPNGTIIHDVPEADVPGFLMGRVMGPSGWKWLFFSASPGVAQNALDWETVHAFTADASGSGVASVTLQLPSAGHDAFRQKNGRSRVNAMERLPTGMAMLYAVDGSPNPVLDAAAMLRLKL